MPPCSLVDEANISVVNGVCVTTNIIASSLIKFSICNTWHCISKYYELASYRRDHPVFMAIKDYGCAVKVYLQNGALISSYAACRHEKCLPVLRTMHKQ